MFIDSHCHPLLQKEKKREEIFENFKKSGGKYLISIGVDINSSKKSILLAQENEFILSTIGIHPCDILKDTGTLLEKINILEKLYKENKANIVGIGECGLDYHWIDKNNLEAEKKLQKEYFIAQIELAKKYNLPVIIHNREAGNDILQILEETNCKNFIIHCFSEDLEFAEKCIELDPDCVMSFSGIVTFSSAKDIQKTAEQIPLKNIIIETDAPYLTPVPYRGREENEPAYTKYVLEKIIAMRTEGRDIIEKQIFENTLKIYGLKKTKALL